MSQPTPSFPSITVVISSLGPGGAERVMVSLVNAWARDGTAATIITLAENCPAHYKTIPSIQRIVLPFKVAKSRSIFSSIFGNIRRVLALRQAIRSAHSQITLAFLDRTNILTLLATIGLPGKVLISERCSVEHTAQTLGFVWRLLRVLLYPRANYLIVQTEAEKRKIIARGLLRAPIAVLPNPIPEQLSNFVPRLQSPASPRIVGMGRLTNQKGFDLLIAAFALVVKSHPTVELVIWGDGPERGRLMEQIRTLELTGRVSLPGVTSTPWDELASASIFVLSSRFEGFPNVLLEAMALGRPCISFDCPHGPRDISVDGRDAILVGNGDVQAMAHTIVNLLSNPELQLALGAKAKSVWERYSIVVVRQKWDEVLLGTKEP